MFLSYCKCTVTVHTFSPESMIGGMRSEDLAEADGTEDPNLHMSADPDLLLLHHQLMHAAVGMDIHAFRC